MDNPETTLSDEMKIACCLTCLLSKCMKDCPACRFNVGLIIKGLQAIKQIESTYPIDLKGIYHVTTES